MNSVRENDGSSGKAIQVININKKTVNIPRY